MQTGQESKFNFWVKIFDNVLTLIFVKDIFKIPFKGHNFHNFLKAI